MVDGLLERLQSTFY